MSLHCLIVDDERPARHEMRQLLSRFPEITVIGEAATVDSAVALTALHRPDLVFLDIQLAGETGFDYLARLTDPVPRIIFVTAHDQFAIRAFECNALDYLLKPVPPDRLAKTINRLEAPKPRRAEADDVVLLKAPSLARLVPWRSIRTIVSEGNYTRVHLEDGASVLIPRPLKNWLDLVPDGFFLQAHRTTLVRLDAIREIRTDGYRHQLGLSDGSWVAVSRTHWPAIRQALEAL